LRETVPLFYSSFEGNCSLVLLAALFSIIPPVLFFHAHIVSPEDGGFTLLGNVNVPYYFELKIPSN
jgi:hypothetical protein